MKILNTLFILWLAPVMITFIVIESHSSIMRPLTIMWGRWLEENP